MADFDIHIRGGTIVDGHGSLAIEATSGSGTAESPRLGGRSPGSARKTIDAGRVSSSTSDRFDSPRVLDHS